MPVSISALLGLINFGDFVLLPTGYRDQHFAVLRASLHGTKGINHVGYVIGFIVKVEASKNASFGLTFFLPTICTDRAQNKWLTARYLVYILISQTLN